MASKAASQELLKLRATNLLRGNLTAMTICLGFILAMVYNIWWIWSTTEWAWQKLAFILPTAVILIFVVLIAFADKAKTILLASPHYQEAIKTTLYRRTKQAFDRAVRRIGLDHGNVTLLIELFPRMANAFHAGSRRESVFTVNAETEEILDDQELEAVSAHEIGHRHNNDTTNRSLLMSLRTLFGVLFWMSFFLWIASVIFNLIFGVNAGLGYEASFSGMMGEIAIRSGIYAFLSQFLVAYYSRRQEEMADLFAYYHGYGEALKSSLVKLYQHQQQMAIIRSVIYRVLGQPLTLFTKGPRHMLQLLYFEAIHENHLAVPQTLGQRARASHPPIEWRFSKLDELCSADEGTVPDKVQFGFWGFMRWFVGPVLSVGLTMAFGLPQTLILCTAGSWLVANIIYESLGRITPPSDNQVKQLPTWLLVSAGLIALFLIFGFWILGLTVLFSTKELVLLYPLFALMIVLWTLKAVFFFFQKRSGVADTIHDFATQIVMGYYYGTIVVITMPLVVTLIKTVF